MEIQKNIKLSRYTSFHIGGKAEFFADVKKVDELMGVLDFARSNKLIVFTIGGGSNVLLPDNGIKGLVIKLSIKGVKFNDNRVYIGAGEIWDNVVSKTVAKNLGGIENLSLIPGTVGGAIYQNIGAYGVEIKDVVTNVRVLDIRSGIIKNITNKDCKFGYRTSIFQRKAGKDYIILGADLKLSRNRYLPKLQYKDLKAYFQNKIPDIEDVRKAVIKIRRSKLVYPTKDIGTVGSFFKNPTITTRQYIRLMSIHPDIIGKDLGNNQIKLFAGQLIEKAGWKNRRIKNAGVSNKHAMVLISYRGAKSDDILNLAELIEKSVSKKFGVKLKPEVKIVL